MNRVALFVLSFVLISYNFVTAQVPDQAKVIAGAERAVEKAAKSLSPNAPGCAVGVSLDGKSVYEKGFGMADLEYNIPITPQTIFESGSVAKQFTAASIVLLSLEGKLKLDDPVRNYVPELPDYGSPLTVRHLLNHTGGLRDWGSVMALTGVGRGDRVISQAVAIDVITRQKALDFVPGAEYSYSNSGYNLLAEIVERVSKQKFPAFVQERIFKPLGMSNSSWRDDYQRVVPNRAQAYSGPPAGPWRLNMPIMNVYGNGGMLTTVGDWLKWNAALDSRTLGAKFVDELETVGVLNDGRKITYALGLTITKQNGFRQVAHDGATAGYATDLTRYPDLKLSIAVMCNTSSRDPGALEGDIFKEIVGPFSTPSQPEPFKADPASLPKYVGIWRSERTHMPNFITLDNGALKINGGPMIPQSDGSFVLGQQRFVFKTDSDGNPVSFEINNNGDLRKFTRQTEWKPTADELSALAGRWYSDEADATVTLVVVNGKAFLTQRPTTKLELQPRYKDGFTINGQPGTVIWFTRDGSQITMHVGMSRLRDMPFTRV